MDPKISQQLIHNSPKKSFKEFCNFINKLNVLTNADTFLKKLTIKSHLNARIFLTLFLTYHFKKHILEEGDFEEIYFKKITNIHKFSLFFQINLNSLLIEYSKLFKQWKKLDSEKQLKIYSETYHELEMLKLKTKYHNQPHVHSTYKNSIEPIQNKILKNTRKLFKEEGEQYLKKYNDTHKKLCVNLYDKLEDGMKKSFWSLLQKDLDKTTPDLKQFPGILKDIKETTPEMSDFFKDKIDINMKNTINKILNDYKTQ